MRIGTRGSALALAQAEYVAGLLGEESELVVISTLGDRGESTLDKSRWVSALEHALLAGHIDLAVHSAKDVPADLEPGLELVAVPPRSDPRDVICGAPGLKALAPGARVGTSSIRRQAQVRAARDDLEVLELRGNVDTRLRKLSEGQADVLILAAAGLERLGRGSEAGGPLGELVPAAGQGALAVEARPGTLTGPALARVNDPAALACVTAERDLVRALGASCHTPVGAYARPLDGDRVELTAWVGLPDGSAWLEDQVRVPAAEAGGVCAERMLAAGALELLSAAETTGAA